MSDILLAADEVAATTLVHDAETQLGTLPAGPVSETFGLVVVSAGAGMSLTGGSVDLIPPDLVRIVDCDLHYALALDLSIDLNQILPHFCLPRVCVPTPFGRICTPRICIDWVTISVPVHYADVAGFTADFKLNPHLSGSEWLIDITIVDIPELELSPAAAAILVAIGVAVTPFLLAVPFAGPFLALAVDAILATIAVAGITGLLGLLLTPFLSGLTLTVYRQPRVFEVLPASGPIDPRVTINLDAVAATVDGSGGEDELVLAVDISP